MRSTLDDSLTRAFPMLYRDRYASPSDTYMCWGFPGDGWFALLWDLSEGIEQINRSAGCHIVVATQVKQKFGTLRFYYSCFDRSYYEIIDSLIADAEARSSKTCEECGEPGRLREQAFVQTLCDLCFT